MGTANPDAGNRTEQGLEPEPDSSSAGKPQPDGSSSPHNVDQDRSKAEKRWSLRNFFLDQRNELIRDALLGTAFVVVAFSAASWWDSLQAEREQDLESHRTAYQEVLENTRFVRQVVIDGSQTMPFSSLRLSGAQLSGLDLGCTGAEDDSGGGEGGGTGCAQFAGADLSEANLARTILAGANLTEANLTGARLFLADLTRADLTGADLTGANLNGANLAGAILTSTILEDASLEGSDLSGADFQSARMDPRSHPNAEWDLARQRAMVDALERARLRSICFDSTTVWPADYRPASESTGCLTWPPLDRQYSQTTAP